MVEAIPIKDLIPEEPNRILDDLAPLIENIDQVGVLNLPIVAVYANGERQLIAGERRIRAANACGHEEVECRFVEMPEDPNEALMEMLVLRFSENHHRKDMHPVEEAELVTQFKELSGLTDEEVGEQLGMNRWKVQDCLRIGGLPEEERTKLKCHTTVSSSVIAELSRLSDEVRQKQMDLLLKRRASRATLRAMRSREAASIAESVPATAQETGSGVCAQIVRRAVEEPMRQGPNAESEIEPVPNSSDPPEAPDPIVIENDDVVLTIRSKRSLEPECIRAAAISLIEAWELGGAA